MAGLQDFLQGASNSVASNVSAPVDGLAWLLRKAGVPIPDAPMGGSDWMAQNGLTAQPQNRNMGLLGEATGGLTPMLIAAKAPQIARGLLQGADNLAASRTMNPQTGAIVWHGSPHKFDKFDSSKIGTGEGAQAYGHGLYLAENPAVAKQYQESLTNLYGVPTTIDGGGKSVPIPLWLADKIKQGGNIDTAISEWTQRAAAERAAMKTGMQPWIHESNAVRFEDELKNLLSIKTAGGGKVADAGSLYKVDLPDEHIAKMLDWDKPLSQQAPEVQAALAKTKNKQLRAVIDYASSPYSTPGLEGEVKTMGEAIKLLGMNTNPAKGSAMLAKQGIPGIRYLDGGSRGAGSGTSNYVVFPGNEGLLNILERNGMAP